MQPVESGFRLTKIIATLGPASEAPETIAELIREGVRVFRLNFSHGSPEEHRRRIHAVRAASREADVPVAILGDLCGPKIRIGKVAEGGVVLHPGQPVLFQADAVVAAPAASAREPVAFSTNTPAIVQEVQTDHRVLLDDGAVRLVCEGRDRGRLVCRVVEGGIVTSNKGVNLPDTALSVPAMTPRDYDWARFAVEHELDFLALSFVRSGDDVRRLKQELVRLGARPSEDQMGIDNPLEFSAIEIESEGIIPVISKIEKPQAIDNLDSILRESDAVMVARGDLGVEMDLAEVAVLQKRIVRLCQEYGIPVIVATQMLQSMIESAGPTRAEVSDVANAIFDGADAVMLSGETSIGRHPVQAVRMMSRIAAKTHRYILDQAEVCPRTRKALERKRMAAALAHGVQVMVHDLDIRLLAVWTQFGGGAVYLSQQRIPRPILAFSPSEATLRRMSLLYGLTPLRMAQPASTGQFIEQTDRLLLERGWAARGDAVAIVLGEPIAKPGITNRVCLHYVGEA
ncbi:MAG: pyruvate kinase [Phycisphaerae bacterium]|nr:pyruvate kinase [Phycisphaerae bacterium]